MKSEFTAKHPLAGQDHARKPMTDEIQYLEEELNDLVGEVQRGMEAIKRLHGPARSEKISEMANRLQRARQVLHSFKVEMRDLPRDRTAMYDTRHRELQETIGNLQRELQQAQLENERQQIGVRTVDEMSTQEVLQEAGKVQDQSLAAVKRMQQNIADSREVGTATAVKLEGQTRQLKNIDADIMKVKSNLNRADLLLRAFMRKMATDKIIMGFMLLIFIGVAVIIIWKIVNPEAVEDAGLNVPDEVVDPLGGGRSTPAPVEDASTVPAGATQPSAAGSAQMPSAPGSSASMAGTTNVTATRL